LQFGKVPTTPTTASVVAGVQVQEVLKLLHGQPTLAGRGFVFEGRDHSSYITSYARNDLCLSHDPLERVEARPGRAESTTCAEALAWARELLGPRARLEFARELLLGFECSRCGAVERRPRPLASASERDALCPCGERRAPLLFHALHGDEDFLARTLADVGVPPWDVVCGRDGDRVVGFELAGDAANVLGLLAEGNLEGGAA
jgi:adenylyltransferase/sulfurtransferase